VRRLADDSSRATLEISLLIGGIQDEVKNAVQTSENGRRQIEIIKIDTVRVFFLVFIFY